MNLLNPNRTGTYNYREVVLELTKFAVEREIDDRDLVLANSPEVVITRTARGMAIELVQFIASQRIDDAAKATLVVRYPDGWVQAMKEAVYNRLLARVSNGARLFRRFWLGTYDLVTKVFGQVRMKSESKSFTFDARILYPSIALPEHRSSILVSKRELSCKS